MTSIKIELTKDSDKWTPSAPTATTPSVPVEVKIESSSNGLETNVDIYSVTEFRTTIELQEEDLFVIILILVIKKSFEMIFKYFKCLQTAPGVFCEGRQSLKQLPTMPKSFEFLIQTSTALTPNNEYGLVNTAKVNI